MFVLKTLQTNVCLEPSMLGQETIDAVESILCKRYTDRVMQQVGLVVHVYDVLHIGEGSVYHSRGNVYHDVEFRAIVFCPFLSELLIGTITRMNENGIHVSLGFFDDVFVPPELLQQPAVWNQGEQEWCWKMDEDSDPLYYTLGGKIRFKVHAVKFLSSDEAGKDVPLCSVIGRSDGTGLGMLAWEWGE